MLHGAKRIETTNRQVKKSMLKSCSKRGDRSRRSFWIHISIIVSLSKSVTKRSKSKRLKLVYRMKIGIALGKPDFYLRLTN